MADFLDELMQNREPTDEAPATEENVQPEEVTEQPAPEPQPEAEPAPEPEPQPEAPKEDMRTVPLPTFLEMRDEAKELKRRIAQYEAAQQQQPNAAAPDPFDDPAGFANYQAAAMQQALSQQKMDLSYAWSQKQYGDETVEAARNWALEKAGKDAAFRAHLEAGIAQSPLPFDWIVQQHKRDALLSDIGDNPDDWFTREAAKRGYAPQSAPVAAPVAAVAQQVAKPSAPPRSIASERAAPAPVTPEGDKDGFLAAFR